jgi:hypothetical protein
MELVDIEEEGCPLPLGYLLPRIGSMSNGGHDEAPDDVSRIRPKPSLTEIHDQLLSAAHDVPETERHLWAAQCFPVRRQGCFSDFSGRGTFGRSQCDTLSSKRQNERDLYS